MTSRKSRLSIHVEKTENLVNYLLKRRRESIQNSLVRPLYQEALKTLFLVIILLIDTLITLEIFKTLLYPVNIVFSLSVLGIFLYLDIHLYNLVWGKKGRWSINKYKKVYEKRIEEKKEEI